MRIFLCEDVTYERRHLNLCVHHITADLSLVTRLSTNYGVLGVILVAEHRVQP